MNKVGFHNPLGRGNKIARLDLDAMCIGGVEHFTLPLSRDDPSVPPPLHGRMASMLKLLGHRADASEALDYVFCGHDGDVRSQRTHVNVENVRQFVDSIRMDASETTGDKLVRLKQRAGMTLESIAKASGYRGRSSIQRYFSADFEGHLPAEAAVALAKGLAGRGDPEITADDLLRLSIAGSVVSAEREDDTYVLEVTGSVVAGVWREQSDWPAGERYSIEVGPPPYRGAKRFAVRMEGRSMDLTIPPGSDLEVLWIKFTDIEPQPGDLVIVERQKHDLTEMTCKRLDIEDGELVLRCESTLPEFQDVIRVGKPDTDQVTDDEVQIIGIVLHSQQRHMRRKISRS
jgi:SOS-response transcriptional repressor LexA